MTAYATTLQVFKFMRWDKDVPNFVPGTTPVLETVDDSGTLAQNSVIYLDQNRVIDRSLILSYGTAATATQTTLTQDTDYSVDFDKAKITILPSGATAIGVNSVFAEYKYNEFAPDSLVSDIIDRATKEINLKIFQEFGEFTNTLDEQQIGRGPHDRLYRVKNLPLELATTTLNADLNTTATAVTVTCSSGFLANDIITIGNEEMTVVAVPDTTTLTVTRASNDTSAASHNSTDDIINMAVEISNTPVSSTPDFKTLTYRQDYSVDSDTGAIQLLHVDAKDKDDLATDVHPLYKVFNRVRLTYRSGTSSVPDDIQEACVMSAGLRLSDSGIIKALPEGIGEFGPQAKELIRRDIDEILKRRQILLTRGF